MMRAASSRSLRWLRLESFDALAAIFVPATATSPNRPCPAAAIPKHLTE
jgi:hypothetical protein